MAWTTPATTGRATRRARRSSGTMIALVAAIRHGTRLTRARAAARKTWSPPAARGPSTASPSTRRLPRRGTQQRPARAGLCYVRAGPLVLRVGRKHRQLGRKSTIVHLEHRLDDVRDVFRM